MADLRTAYLELLKKALRSATAGPMELYHPVQTEGGPFLRTTVQKVLLKRGHARLMYPMTIDPGTDPEGKRFVTALPPGAMTMIGARRLDNIEQCVTDVIANAIPGDLIETGVWRGGATILMRAVLKAYGVTDRSVYVADSFEGLPPPDADRYPADTGLYFNKFRELAISLEEVRANFERYDLLDDQVVFVKGWFRDTLPGLKDHRWSVVRLDGDLYESTTDALVNLYPGLSPGGWIIIDDYEIEACRKAVTDFRTANGIDEEIITVDWTGICWKKSAG